MDLREIRDRTCKSRDAWWTVLLVDPIAIRLVRLVAPYRWITPNLLSGLGFVLGLGAAWCFAMADRWWLVAGAVLFHLSFVIDCMDGKIARLNGTGSMFGAWFDFIFDRVRVVICAIALTAGQYAATGNVAWVWLCAAIIGLDLFRYVNGSQMAKTKASMAAQRRALLGEPVTPTVADDEGDTDEEDTDDPAKGSAPRSPYQRVRSALLKHRIRIHLFSGIEFEMTVFIIGPLIGAVFWTAVVAGALLLLFEALLVFRLLQLIRRWGKDMAAIRREQDAVNPIPTPTRV
ncbi:MAG TPA: CDP-alcohol phosphatidyltransferase family protein [Actinoplanes sp.]|nr:CDP-alcohol phosphatidyltransferase family protein [Actinoplanes sp.]